MSGAFTAEVLSEKLIKLNASQQSIETLSHWCIYHRKRAKHIVKTWEKEFFSAPKERRVSFLYLANDIIQNSRKKGTEFVAEFWKVLGAALKDVKENGDDNGRNVVSRLVNIWEERKVFGSRAQTLRETLLGNGPVPEFETQGEKEHTKEERHKKREKEKETTTPSASYIKIRQDGSILEKVVKAFVEVSDKASNEDAVIHECNSTMERIEVLVGENVTENETPGIKDELQLNLEKLVEQLETNEKSRQSLVSCLREALFEQETKLEHIRSYLQAFRSATDKNVPHGNMTTTFAPLGGFQSLAPSSDDNNNSNRSRAAEIAAKLAASTSSAAMLSSILSSLTAEESAALGLHTDKRPRLDTNSAEGATYVEPQQYSVLPQFIGAANIGLPYSYSGVMPPPPPPPPPPGLQIPQHLSQQQIPQMPPPPPPPLPPGVTPNTYHSVPVPSGYYSASTR